MLQQLPERPSLEQLKNRAKDLLRACRAGDAEAARRIRAQHSPPDGGPTATVTLVLAQHVIAREYGFPSWPKLKQHIELMEGELARRLSLRQQVERLGIRDWRVILAATDVLARAGKAGLDAVIEGLSHPAARIRRECAGFMDHHGNDECVAPLRQVILNDPIPSVRRVAVHSLGCQRCKPSPLTEDLIDLLVQVALHDNNAKVRQTAAWILGTQGPDARAVAALQTILREESDRTLRQVAHHALKRADPSYRKAVDDRARERGIARAQSQGRPGD